MKLFVITGQTATGKTSHALKLAEELDGELVNCDSRQIYKHLDIITGKDLTDHTFHNHETVRNFDLGYYLYDSRRLWLYDIVDPKHYFSSFDYQHSALRVIKNIIHRGKTPILVGGTYFYIQHLLYDIESQNIPPDWTFRKSMEQKTIKELQDILQEKAAQLFESLNNSERNNPQRLIRKIEICMSEKTITSDQDLSKEKIALPAKLGIPDIQINLVGFSYKSKDSLHEAISKRVEERLKLGALDEVKKLLKMGYSEHDPGMRTIGYQQLIPFVRKNGSNPIPQLLIDDWITKEIQYAKRQLTFMKKNPNLIWTER